MISRKIKIWCLAFRHRLRLKAVTYVFFPGRFCCYDPLLVLLTHIMSLMHFSTPPPPIFISVYFCGCFTDGIERPPSKMINDFH